MAKCPNCNAAVVPDVDECPACNASFWVKGGWFPTPESPDEERITNEKLARTDADHEKRVQIATRKFSAVVPGCASMANLSLALAFLLSWWFTPFGHLFGLIVDKSILADVPPFKGHFLNVCINYWAPAVLIYLLLRLTHLQSYLRFGTFVNWLFSIANFLMILYIAARILASTVQGGGASFVVMSLSSIIVLPARIMLVLGAILVVVRTLDKRNHLTSSPVASFATAEAVMVMIAFSPPLFFISTLFIGKDAPYMLSRQAEHLFAARCATAVETIVKVVDDDVEGVYVDPDGGVNYGEIKDGVYRYSSFGILGEPLVNSGLLRFFERNNDRPRPEDNGPASYRRHAAKDWKGEPANELASKYAVLGQKVTTKEEEKLGISGRRTSIVIVGSNEEIASTTYFASNKHHKICGHETNGTYSTSDFVIRALRLKRQFPSAFNEPPVAKQ